MDGDIVEEGRHFIARVATSSLCCLFSIRERERERERERNLKATCNADSVLRQSLNFNLTGWLRRSVSASHFGKPLQRVDLKPVRVSARSVLIDRISHKKQGFECASKGHRRQNLACCTTTAIEAVKI